MRFAKALEAERDEIRLMREEKRVLDEKNFRAFEEMMREGLEMRRRREIGKATRGEGGILEDVPSHSGCIGDTGSSLRTCLLYTSPSPRDLSTSRMPSSA